MFGNASGLNKAERSRHRNSAEAKTITPVLVIAFAATVLVVLSFLIPSTQAAFTAKVTNSTNTAGTRSFFTCKDALAQLAVNRGPFFGYLMNGVPVSRTESTYPAVAATAYGTNDLVYLNYGAAGSAAPAPAATSGCTRDTPQTAVTFNASNMNCSYSDVYWGKLFDATFTIGTWFRSPAGGSGPLIGFAAQKPTTTSVNATSHDRSIYIDTAGRMVFGVYYSSGPKIVSSPAGTDYRDGQWHHVTARFSPTSMALYIDGQQVGSRSDNPPLASIADYAGYWRIGCQRLVNWQNGAGQFVVLPSYYTGNMQYAFAYHSTLSDAEIQSLWLAGRP